MAEEIPKHLSELEEEAGGREEPLKEDEITPREKNLLARLQDYLGKGGKVLKDEKVDAPEEESEEKRREAA